LSTRLGAALSLYAFAGLGLFLLVAPWTPVWTQATYTLLPPSVGRWVLSGWVRGVASGLGAVDLLVAVQVGAELWGQLRVARGAASPDKKKAAPGGAARGARNATPPSEERRNQRSGRREA
jgi:hypothetical protein